MTAPSQAIWLDEVGPSIIEQVAREYGQEPHEFEKSLIRRGYVAITQKTEGITYMAQAGTQRVATWALWVAGQKS